jgi:hypothetical protein
VIRDELVGRWSLVSYELNRKGDTAHPFGAQPQGLLDYAADGRMWVHFGRRDRPHLETDYFTSSAEDKAAAFEAMAAYTGTWRVDEAAGVVVHAVELAWLPNWEGTEQRRHFVLDGDVLTLSSDKGWSSSRLVWRRVRQP